MCGNGNGNDNDNGNDNGTYATINMVNAVFMLFVFLHLYS